MSRTDLYCAFCGAKNDLSDEICFACRQPLDSETDEPTERQFLHNRYRLLHKVGEGGFSAVYKALDLHSEQTVAIKAVTLRGLSVQEKIDATDTYNREVGILSVIQHRTLPRIHEYFADPECWYVVMDFIDGITLERYLEQRESQLLPVEDVFDMGIVLCDVLDYLHQQQPAIIFRDLKPANIMLAADGHLYLIDFGIARRFKPGQAKDTIPFGSSGYAAPEQYGRAQTTPQADIFSLGALLHHLLSGSDPALAPFTFVPLPHNRPGMAELNQLLAHMVELDASKRPVSMVIIKQELLRIAGMQCALMSVPDSAHTPQQPATFTWQIDKPSVWDASTHNFGVAGGGQAMQMQSVPQAQQFVPPFFAHRPAFSNGYAMASLVLSASGIIIQWYFSLVTMPSILFRPPAPLSSWFIQLLVLVSIPVLLGVVFGRIGMRRAKKLHPVLLPGFKTARNGLLLGMVALILYSCLYIFFYVLQFFVTGGF